MHGFIKLEIYSNMQEKTNAFEFRLKSKANALQKGTSFKIEKIQEARLVYTMNCDGDNTVYYHNVI